MKILMADGNYNENTKHYDNDASKIHQKIWLQVCGLWRGRGGEGDGGERQELDGHDHFLDDQDQDQCHPVDDRSQHPSRSFRPGLFSDCTLKEEMEKVFSFQIIFSHSPSNQISAGGRLSHCRTLRPGCLSWVEHIHYTNTNTQIQTHKYKHTNTQIQQYTNTQITKNKYTNTQSWWSYPHNDYNHLYVK